MANFPITLSRRGYAYQDKYALLKLLKFLCNGRVKEFHVDFPFGNKGNSLDILIVLQKPEEKYVYEIKTGEKFKRDKYKEVSEALISLYYYQTQKKCKVYLIISPELRSGIAMNWGDLQFIRDEGERAKNNRGDTMLEVAKRCRKLFGFEKKAISLENFIRFVKSLKLEEGPSCEKDGEIDSYPDLEDLIDSEIRNLGKKLDILSSELEMPNLYIVLGLLEIVRQGAEGKLRIVPSSIEALTNFFACRVLIAKHISYGRGITSDELLTREKEKIIKRLSEITKVSQRIIEPTYKIIEGKPIR